MALADPLTLIPAAAEAAFDKAEYDVRLKRLRAVMAAKGLDLLLTSGPENIFYLTGQQTPGYYTFQCLGIPAQGEAFLVMRSLETMNARLKSVLTDIEGYGDDAHPAAAVAASLKRRGWAGKRVAIDRNSWFLTVNLYERLVQEFGSLLDGSGLIEPLRRVKSAAELAQIEKAAAANDAGMQAGLDATRQGASENDVAAALFRTVAIGKIPPETEDMYKVCREGLEAAIEKLRPGNTCADVHNACQAVVDRHGYTAAYRKRTGYSIGISFAPDWGEGNILSLFHDVAVPLEPGMVFHVPAALRSYGKFTVAVSETVVVTSGAAKTVSRIGRDLVRA